jgi:hypothetical protein
LDMTHNMLINILQAEALYQCLVCTPIPAGPALIFSLAPAFPVGEGKQSGQGAAWVVQRREVSTRVPNL